MTEPRNSQRNEEIDVLAVLERALAFLSKFRLLFISATILGLGAGLLLYLTIPKTYSSRLILHSVILTNNEQIQIVKNWNSLLKEKEYDALATALDADMPLLSKVKKLKAAEIQKLFVQNNPNGFYIDAVVTDISILDTLQRKLLYGLENTHYLKQRVAVKKENLGKLIDKVTTEISKLDSTKTRIDDIIASRRINNSSLILDVSNINRQLIELNEKLLFFQEELRFANAVQVLQGFSKFSKPDDPNLLPLLAIGLIFFLGLAWFIALTMQLRSTLKERARRNLKHA